MAVSAVKSEPAEAEAAPKPAGKKGLIKLVLIGVLVLGAGGGGYWYWSHRAHEEPKEAKTEAPKPPVFMPLETFTVNLQLVDNPQFLQTGITLKVAGEKVVEEIKLQMPVVRDRILILMSSRKAADLLTVEGKRQLGEEIAASVNGILAQAAGKAEKAEAKGADAKDAKDPEEEKDAAEAKDAADKEPKDGKTAAGKKAEDGAEQPVQSVLFTSFIIQ
jgi:flagellar FliL protein